jgi:hypothetical protein
MAELFLLTFSTLIIITTGVIINMVCSTTDITITTDTTTTTGTVTLPITTPSTGIPDNRCRHLRKVNFLRNLICMRTKATPANTIPNIITNTNITNTNITNTKPTIGITTAIKLMKLPGV